ncbi:hypothetical protein [Dialister invisus]|jgi:hypothetical protein|uniref:hypothetical protein n=1 Tax=Dialister invisus TaxID=218538 RepID=UPI003AB1B077
MPKLELLTNVHYKYACQNYNVECDPSFWVNCPPDAGSCYPDGTCNPDVNDCGPDYGGDCFPEAGCFPSGDDSDDKY